MLIRGRAWGSNEVTLDATFRPTWQTNRAMLWSLFASTPVLCKVRSKNYDESEWCRLESEMFDHLVKTADFMRGRLYLEFDVGDAGILDQAAKSSLKTHRVLDVAAGLESPPMELFKLARWQGALVRAVAIANKEEWSTDPGWTVARCLVYSRLPYPLIIRQRAGQNADKWPFLEEVNMPVFTEHLPEQRLPQSEVFFSLGGPWPAAYYNAVIDYVVISPILTYACKESLKFGSDPVMVRADGGLSALSIGEKNDFEEWLRNHLKQKEEGSD